MSYGISYKEQKTPNLGPWEQKVQVSMRNIFRISKEDLQMIF
jgi:hypothetical protein